VRWRKRNVFRIRIEWFVQETTDDKSRVVSRRMLAITG
jgi:hypothetical protein